jgi:hypothetical protein
MKFVCLTATLNILGIGLLVFPAQANQIILSDCTFNTSSWQAFELRNTTLNNTFLFAASQSNA